jgi:hypothetical protein
MAITNPTNARGIFYKLAQEFKEMDRRNKILTHQIENARISKLKFETQQIFNVTPKHHRDIPNDKKMVIPRQRRFKDLKENR